MTENKPLISILMAVYEPRMDWLREQLLSLEAQDYPNLRLYIRDDASPTAAVEDIARLAGECVRSFPFTVERNGENLGSNGTFERLVAEAEGEYFAFCDQDDVWRPEKLSVLQETMERENALLVCSDMTIIDETGRVTAESITEIRRHHVFRSGEGLWDTLWYANFASGCALLVRSAEAKRAVPFDPYMYYDHYIALCCADRGRVISLPERKLLLHREHGSNQSSLLRGVTDRESYIRVRVEDKLRAVDWLCGHFPGSPGLMERLSQGRIWLDARRRYAGGDRSAAKTVWKYRRFGPRAAALELALPWLPEAALRLVLNAARKNRI
ncbi:MAG: glycosyltransferase [Oscillospiraceae bacterium]|nr:glycosyltransferase [Oscillospiraceae bacterium]